jgi:hypothetical protein
MKVYKQQQLMVHTLKPVQQQHLVYDGYLMNEAYVVKTVQMQADVASKQTASVVCGLFLQVLLV